MCVPVGCQKFLFDPSWYALERASVACNFCITLLLPSSDPTILHPSSFLADSPPLFVQAPSAWLQDTSLLRRLVRAESPDAILEILENQFGQQRGGVLGSEEGATLILAALEAGNADLAFGMLEAMRAAGLKARIGKGGHEWRWRWTPPDVKVYAALVRGLAASLRVGEAIEVVGQVRRRGLPKGEEVRGGK